MFCFKNINFLHRGQSGKGEQNAKKAGGVHRLRPPPHPGLILDHYANPRSGLWRPSLRLAWLGQGRWVPLLCSFTVGTQRLFFFLSSLLAESQTLLLNLPDPGPSFFYILHPQPPNLQTQSLVGEEARPDFFFSHPLFFFLRTDN